MKHTSIFLKMVCLRSTAILCAAVLFAASILSAPQPAHAASPALVILSRYSATLKIGQSFALAGVATNGKWVRFTSSKSAVASVNTYGLVTAKKAGTCTITGKVAGGEASCKVTVTKTTITLSAASITMENGAQVTLKGQTSNGSAISWKSQKSSIAEIDDAGRISAKKVGETTITATADGTKKTCHLTVKKPKITLNYTSASLYRCQSLSLSANVSSGRKVTWKSQKSSVATISNSGKVTAKKHGQAKIRATVDGATKECTITVLSPQIKLGKTSMKIKKGKTAKLTATVSSGNQPTYKSSRTSIASIDSKGIITAKKKGSCILTVSEDGTKETCHIQVVS